MNPGSDKPQLGSALHTLPGAAGSSGNLSISLVPFNALFLPEIYRLGGRKWDFSLT